MILVGSLSTLKQLPFQVRGKQTWLVGRSAGAPLLSWLLYLVVSYTQTALGWDPGGPGSVWELGWWLGHGAVWYSDLWLLRHSHSTWWKRCGHSPAQREPGTDWQWTWAGGCCCVMTWLQPLSAADHIPIALYGMQGLSAKKYNMNYIEIRGKKCQWMSIETFCHLTCIILESSSNDVLQSPLYSWASCWIYLLTLAEDVPSPAPAPVSSYRKDIDDNFLVSLLHV